MTEAPAYPSHEDTLALYANIENTAQNTLRSGNAVDNPLIDPSLKDKRHFVSVDLNLGPSPVKAFLADAIERVKAAEPGFVTNKEEHLHLTMAEVSVNPEGRKSASLSAEGVKAFYRAIRDNYPDQKPVRLQFEKIMLTTDPPLDPAHPEKRSIAIVAAFTSIDDEVFKVRSNIVGAIETAGLTTASPRHPSKVLFVSLGRFAQPPAKVREDYPIISLISELNAQAPLERQIAESELEVISTATKTVLSTGHVFLSPPIEFSKKTRSGNDPVFLRPHVRSEQFQKKARSSS